jgi:hypothetical protein
MFTPDVTTFKAKEPDELRYAVATDETVPASDLIKFNVYAVE